MTARVIDFCAQKRLRENETFLFWARMVAMEQGRRDFEDHDFWDEVWEDMQEEAGQ